jgi:hypothetical protein
VRLHQQLLGKVPHSEEAPTHISEVPEGNIFVESISIDDNFVIDTDFDAGIAQTEHVEVAAQ